MSTEFKLNEIMILKTEERTLADRISVLEKDILTMEKEIQAMIKDVNVRKAELRDSFENWNQMREALADLHFKPETVIRSQLEVIFEGGLVKSVPVRELYAFGKSFRMEKEDVDAVLEKLYKDGEITYPKPDALRYENRRFHI